MHDPSILAFEIKSPFWSHRPWPKGVRKWDRLSEDQKRDRSSFWKDGYRNTAIQIWHEDPCADGSDDSCGYSYIKLGPERLERLRNAAWAEAYNPHFLRQGGKEWTGTIADAECLYRGLVLLVCRVLRIRITFDEAAKYASEALHIRDTGKAGDIFCYQPGYHSNSPVDTKEWRQDHFTGILCGVARTILTDRRPWWKHPKWHFWHWKIRIPFLVSFKRWAFSSCCKCGKGFSWGYAPVTDQWDNDGPYWFRSERNVYHSNCNQPSCECVSEQTTS